MERDALKRRSERISRNDDDERALKRNASILFLCVLSLSLVWKLRAHSSSLSRREALHSLSL